MVNRKAKKIATVFLILIAIIFCLVYFGKSSSNEIILTNLSNTVAPIEGNLSREYEPGTYTISLHNIPDTAKGMSLVFTRENWPEGNVVKITSTGKGEGQTFKMGPLDFSGGIIINPKTGKENDTSTWKWWWPGEAEKDVNGEYVLDSEGNRVRREIKITDVDVEFSVLQTIKTKVTLEYF